MLEAGDLIINSCNVKKPFFLNKYFTFNGAAECNREEQKHWGQIPGFEFHLTNCDLGKITYPSCVSVFLSRRGDILLHQVEH